MTEVASSSRPGGRLSGRERLAELEPGPTERDWRHAAACRGEDPELFFPIGSSALALVQTADAKAVCRRCPAIDACLRWAVATGQEFGVWGGLSEDERRALKRRARRAAEKSRAAA
jgi:WhiB family redox-sensing transcriptional regulator